MRAAKTSVRVSRVTLRDLDHMRRLLGTRTADETIRKLIREHRARVLAQALGSGKGLLKPFSEDDRLDSHY